MGYYAPQPAQPERPTAVTVIAVLAILYGAALLLGLPLNIMQVTGGFRMPGPGGDMAAEMMAQPAMAAWSRILIGLNAITGVLWIVCAVGMLQLRRWARYGAIGVLVFCTATYFLGQAITLPAVTAAMASGAFAPSAGPPVPVDFVKGIMAASAVLGGLFVLAIAITFIVLLTRRNVIYAFEPERDPARYAAYAQPPYTGVPDESQPPGGYPPPQ